jgi:DNA repair ATPase RecN
MFTLSPIAQELHDLKADLGFVYQRVWRLDQALGSCHQYLWREHQRYRRYRHDSRAYHDEWDPRSLAHYATQYAQILEELAAENQHKVTIERRIAELYQQIGKTPPVGQAIYR